MVKKKTTANTWFIKNISLSLFLFILWWGLGGDTFFSIYVEYITQATFGVMLIGTLLAFMKLVVVIPVGILNGKGMKRYMLLLGKLFYVFSGLCYFYAGIYHSIWMLVIAVILNGIGSSMIFTTYRSLYTEKSQLKNRSKVFGFFFSSINLAYVIGALISAYLVRYIELPYLFLFVIIFSLISLLQDESIQEWIKKRGTRSWKKYHNSLGEVIDRDSPEGVEQFKQVIGKKGVLKALIKEASSLAPRKKMYKAVRGYGAPMYVALAAHGLVGFMNYVGFLFIPIIAVANNLSLSQIAIVFATMRLPYLVNIVLGGVGDKYNKKLIITIVMICIAICYFLLGIADGFYSILALSFWISLGVAISAPITSALVTGYAKPRDQGLMAGMQEFMGRAGDIIGSLGFGAFAAIIGIKPAFMVLWVALFVLGFYLFLKKILKVKTRDNEAEKEKLARIPF